MQGTYFETGEGKQIAETVYVICIFETCRADAFWYLSTKYVSILNKVQFEFQRFCQEWLMVQKRKIHDITEQAGKW
jgi:hypothetical protein